MASEERFGPLLARLRREQGLSQDRLAGLLNDASGNPTNTRHEISRWENERDGRLPSGYWLGHLAAVLGVDLRVLERALAASRRAQGRIAIPAQVITEPQAAAVETWDLTDVLTHTPIGMSTLDAMESAVFEYAALYPVTGPDGMLAATERQMSRLGGALTQPMPVAVRRRVVRLLALLAGVVGHLYVDLGARPPARQLFQLGRLAATEAEDDDMTAWIVATDSIAAFYDNQPARAVELLAEADSLSVHASSPRRRAWIAAMHARALAATGHTEGSLRALESAHQLMGQATDPATGNDFFDAARLDGITGSTMLALRDTTRADNLIGRALDTRAPSDAKGRALLTLDLAACRVVDREPAEAVRLVGQALDIADSSLVRPIAVRAAQVRADMKPWNATRPVAELDERLTEALHQPRKTT